ncbi:MAG: hypothetical protein AAFX93_14895 [Verrucomicrobiota bacterium]
MADKKSKNAQSQPNWHPDFRDSDVLPDVKAVRTNFLINFVALALTVSAVGWFGFSEYQAMTISTSIDEQRKLVQDGAAGNRSALKLSKEFSKLSTKADDLIKFYDNYIYPDDILLEISKSRPENIALESFAITTSQTNVGSKRKPKYVSSLRYTIRGMLKGSSGDDLSELDNYKVVLDELEVLANRIDNIDVSQPTRIENQGLFEFTIVINLKTEA